MRACCEGGGTSSYSSSSNTSDVLIAGVTGEDEKWRYCVEDTGGSVSFAVGAMYVRETFHGDSKASVSIISLHFFMFVMV